jgi:hypothetical protein
MSTLRPRPPALASARPRVAAASTSVQADRWLIAGLVSLSIGLAAVALLGPLATGIVDYRVTETLRNQLIGLDAVSLFIVAPLALLAALFVRRGRAAGYALSLAVGAYTAYMFLQYVVGPAYTTLPGNNEKLFPLCLAIFIGGWLVALTAWNRIGPTDTPGSRRRDRLIGRIVLPLLALLAFVRYVPALADAMSSTPESAGYLAGPAFFWAIALLDLGIFLPATIATCVGLDRGKPWSHKALYLVAGWFGLVGTAVAAMAIAMQINDDPSASVGNTIATTVLGVTFVVLAIAVYRPLRRRSVG